SADGPATQFRRGPSAAQRHGGSGSGRRHCCRGARPRGPDCSLGSTAGPPYQTGRRSCSHRSHPGRSGPSYPRSRDGVEVSTLREQTLGTTPAQTGTGTDTTIGTVTKQPPSARASALGTDPAATSLHFVGIGGVSMQALALWCQQEGFTVSGCDATDSAAVAVLRKAGIAVAVGHDPAHAADADVIIHSMAVSGSHPEISAARATGAPVLKRIELLSELFGRRRTLAVSGTEGKCTTTAMLASMLLRIEPSSSVQLGAYLPAIGGAMRFGDGSWLAAEVDESDPGFADLTCEVAIVTNIEDDHIAG